MVRTLILLAACVFSPLAQPAVPRRDFQELKPLVVLHLGKTADWVAIDAHDVWVGSTKPYAVHRIDPSSNAEIASVALPGEPCAGLAVGFGGVWVPLCGAGGGLARIDTATNTLRARYPVGKVDAECGITTSNDAVWMTANGALVRIDPQSGAVVQRVRLPHGSCNPRYADGIVWVTHAAGAELVAVDAVSGRVLGLTPVNPHPRFLATGAQSVWTLNQGDGSLSQVVARTRQTTHTTALGTPGHGGDIAYDGGFLWTTMMKVPLSLTDAATGELRCQWAGAGGDSLGVANGALWLTDYHGGTVSRFAVKDVLRLCNLGT